MTWPGLRILSEQFEDAQKARIACANRMERGGVDAETYAPQLATMKTAEDAWGLAMRREYRAIVPGPVRAWQQEASGIGEHTLARLLGVVGHPIHAEPYEWRDNPDFDGSKPKSAKNPKRLLVPLEPFDRRVSDLWSYCGHGDPDRRREKGMSADEAAALGNPRAKMLTHLLAEAGMQQKCDTCRANTGDGETWQPSKGCTDCGRYRQVYVARRAETARRDPDGPWSVHRDCSDGHCHNDALRLTGKEILRDLWSAAHDDPDTQASLGGGPDR